MKTTTRKISSISWRNSEVTFHTPHKEQEEENQEASRKLDLRFILKMNRL